MKASIHHFMPDFTLKGSGQSKRSAGIEMKRGKNKKKDDKEIDF